MAYFSNSTDGAILEEQCSRCRFGEDACPVFAAQFLFNYDACGNDVASQILNVLVDENGVCQMREEFKSFLATDKSKQLNLFE